MPTWRGGQGHYKSWCSFSSSWAPSCSPGTLCIWIGLILPNVNELGLISTLGTHCALHTGTSYKSLGRCPSVTEGGEQMMGGKSEGCRLGLSRGGIPCVPSLT